MEEKKRIHRSAAEMYSMIEGWQKSGQTKKAYCAAHKLSEAVFYYWLRRWEENRHQSAEGRFVELRPMSDSVKLTVEYPNGVKIHFSDGLDPEKLQRLLKLSFI